MTAVDAWTAAGQMTPGINIGNTLENTTRGRPAGAIRRSRGNTSRAWRGWASRRVRLPVAWDTYAENGRITPKQFQRVAEVVDWITDAGMYCVLNIHWDGGWIDSGWKERFPQDVPHLQPRGREEVPVLLGTDRALLRRQEREAHLRGVQRGNEL